MTTTVAAIRARLTAVFEAAAPRVLARDVFRRCPGRDEMLVEWCVNNPSDQCLRRFDIYRVGQTVDPNTMHPEEITRTDEQLLITVAYPRLPRLYGEDGISSMEDAMRGDAAQLHDICSSGSTLISGWSAVTGVTIHEPSREGEVWFQTLTITLNYCEAQLLT